MALSIFPLLYTRHCHPSLKLFHLSELELCTHWTPIPHSLLLLTPGNHHYTLSVSLDASYVQYLSFCDWNISLSTTSSRFVHIVACLSFSFLFKEINNDPLQGYVTSQNLFICLFVCFCPFISWWTVRLLPLVSIVNNAIWTQVHKYLFHPVFLLLLDVYPEVGLMDGTVVLLFSFWGSSLLFCMAAEPAYNPISSCTMVPFSHILAGDGPLVLWGCGRSKRCDLPATLGLQQTVGWQRIRDISSIEQIGTHCLSKQQLIF